MGKKASASYLLIVLLTGAMQSNSCLANSYADNPDFPLDRKIHYEFNAVGILQTKGLVDEDGWIPKGATKRKGYGLGTAVLVSPCLIITNNHVVFGNDFPAQFKNGNVPKGFKDFYAMKFSVGIGMHLQFEGSVTAVPVAWGDRGGANQNDWALLRLSSCIGNRPEIGFMEMEVNVQSADMIGNKVALISYPTTSPDMRISYGWVKSYDCAADTLNYTVSSAPQSSGGVVVMDTPEGIRLIGIHRGGHHSPSDPDDFKFATWESKHSNELINIGDIINAGEVRNFITADILAEGERRDAELIKSTTHVNPNHFNLRRKVFGLEQSDPPSFGRTKNIC